MAWHCEPPPEWANGRSVGGGWSFHVDEQENALSALREKRLKVCEIVKRASVVNEATRSSR